MTTTISTHAPRSPRIGQLLREGVTVFYAYLAGGLYVEEPDWTNLQFYIDCEEGRYPRRYRTRLMSNER